jgi:hypothetical protein
MIRAARISDDEVEACYGTRDRYLTACRWNFRQRQRETFNGYVKEQGRLGIPLMTEKQWARSHAKQLLALKSNIAANQHEPF